MTYRVLWDMPTSPTSPLSTSPYHPTIFQPLQTFLLTLKKLSLAVCSPWKILLLVLHRAASHSCFRSASKVIAPGHPHQKGHFPRQPSLCLPGRVHCLLPSPITLYAVSLFIDLVALVTIWILICFLLLFSFLLSMECKLHGGLIHRYITSAKNCCWH